MHGCAASSSRACQDVGPSILFASMPGHRSKHSLRHAGPSHDHFLRNSSSIALAVWWHFDRSVGLANRETGLKEADNAGRWGCSAFQSVRRSVGKLGKPKTACTSRQEVKYSPCVGWQIKQTSSAMTSSSRRLKTSLLQPELSSQQIPLCLPSLLSCPAPPGNSVSSVKRAVHMQPILLEVFRPMLACATVDTHMAIDE